jgi:acetyltransferase
VDTIEELFGLAELLGKQPRPAGPRLAIVTNGGGPGVLATDALIECGGKLAELSGKTFDELNKLLPPHWSRGNPVDILGDASPEMYGRAVEIVSRDENNDGLLVILSPQAVTKPNETAERMRAFAKLKAKPILASWIGGIGVRPGMEILDRAGIPTFEYPDAAARAFCAMWRYSHNLDALYETPEMTATAEIDRSHAKRIIDHARGAQRTLLTEIESKQLLAAYGIPTVETKIANNEDEAVELAKKIVGAVVLKIYSETITHKSDAGGVKLNLRGATAVRRAYCEIRDAAAHLSEGRAGSPLPAVSLDAKDGAHGVTRPTAYFLGVTVQPMIAHDGYELILGSSFDPQFGPVLLFGTGGYFVEVFKDRALGLPPLNRTLARRLMERTQTYSALKKGFRGRGPIDLVALEELLVRFSQLVIEQRWIKEIDINPLLVSPKQIVALDARVVLHNSQIREAELPRSPIRRYPTDHVTTRKIGGVKVTIRPIRPEDEPLMVKFHKTLSDRSVHLRYFGLVSLERRIMHERLRRVCFIDYDREIALVADLRSRDGTHQILGIGRLIKEHGTNEAEFAVLISDPWQGKGFGSELLKLLVQIGRKEGLSRIIGHISPENSTMKTVSEEVGFTVNFDREADEWFAEINL